MPLLQPVGDATRQVTADKTLFDQRDTQAGKTDDSSLAELFRISGALQTSLDIRLVIQAFYDGLSELFGVCALKYCREDSKLELAHGILGRHRCNYQLTLYGKFLGEITLSRRKCFSKADIVLLENLLCTLVNPLNNALLYQEALAAALKDPLTNLNNRRAMEATLTRETELAKRNRSNLSIITLDIDHFKKINDTYGHLTGDKVIIEIARTLENAVRSCDIVFRYGGEEFVVILSCTNSHGACLLAERIRESIAARPIPHDDGEISISASLGVASFERLDDSQSLFSRADTALYEAKHKGRNRTEVHYGEAATADNAFIMEPPKKTKLAEAIV